MARHPPRAKIFLAIRVALPDNAGMETPDILIIGAGIIGCSLARELARAGQRVTVLDGGSVGGGASGAAAGLLTPSFAAEPVGPLADLSRQAAHGYESWIDELRTEGAGDVGFARKGLLEVWLTESEAERAAATLKTLPADYRYERLSDGDLRRREPALGLPTFGGVYYPDDAQVDPVLLTRAVAGLAERAGVRFREHEPVLRLVRDGDRIAAVHTPAASYWPEQVILAAGAWSGGLAECLELDLPVQPIKGQLLEAHCRVAPVGVPLHAGEALLVPRPGGDLLLGVTVEDAGFDAMPTLEGIRTILTNVCRLVPALGALLPGATWAGLRPATPDGWPYMGPLPPLENLWVSTGHFRKGILLAPLAGRLLCQSVLAGRLVDELVPFKPTRRLNTGEPTAQP